MTEREFDSICMNALMGDFKRHIRMTSSEMDADLRGKLEAAVESAEHQIGRILVRSCLTLTRDYESAVRLRRPVIGIVSVKVDGQTVTDYTFNSGTLNVHTAGSRMEVVYTAGPETMRADIKAAVLMHAASLFNNPTDSVETMIKASDNLLRPYRTWGEDDGEQD